MKHFIKILSLALCAACLLSVTALAAEAAPTADKTEILQPQALAAAKIWGKVSKQENGSLLVTSGDPDSANPEVVIHVSEETYCVDAATGASLDMEKVKDGDTLYVWAGPAMTMSLPPQTTAVVIVGNVPADGKVPQYAEITAPAVRSEDEKERVLTIAGGELTVLEDADVSPFRTKNIAALDDLIPGAQILAWTNAAGKADRVLVFPYSCKGYLTANQDGVVLLNGEDVKVKGQIFPVKGEENLEQMYLPLRAVAEAAGYEVSWVSGKGAVVSESGTELFSVQSDSDTAQTPDGERGLLGGCVVDKGTTYLPAADLAQLLQVYYYAA